MADTVSQNWAQYKAGFTNGAAKKNFVKQTPFKYVDANDLQQPILQSRRSQNRGITKKIK